MHTGKASAVGEKRVSSLFLGIDLGSVSLKLALTDEKGGLMHASYAFTSGKPLEVLIFMLADLLDRLGDIACAGIVVTGSGKSLIADALGLPTINEIVAHARGCWQEFPAAKAIIEIGGQDSKYIEIAHREDGSPFIVRHAFNSLCSAGTGAFLDHQAQRLGLSIEAFSEEAYAAAHVPPIAGRCSVFAKSDMIHLQQKGVSSNAIAAGLCHALARNYLATLCKGKLPEMPIVFQGGVAANRGMVRAFCTLLGIAESKLRIPEHHKIMGAIGAALFAREKELDRPVRLVEIRKVLTNTTARDDVSPRPVLKKPLETKATWPTAQKAERAYLGLDVGSVTTKAVLLSPDGSILASTHIPTQSRPIEATREVLRLLSNEGKELPHIAGFYATGSGRYLVRDIFGADQCIDEISAQTRSAKELPEPVDTIIEIGGQDSKFIRLKNGLILDFLMNRMCAAGTGSFLVEQADRLKVRIENDFANLAFESKAPVNLGTRCTVFMDSDLIHHIQQGKGKDDLCAGLAYSIAQNYLDMVVKSRPMGDHVIFQGGVAHNAAVHAAFMALLEKEIMVHPCPTLSGALGAALIARDEMPHGVSCFVGFEQIDQAYTLSSFVCNACENTCEINKVTTGSGRETFFGSLCSRFERSSSGAWKEDSLFTLRQNLLVDDYLAGGDDPGRSRGDIGIPLGLSMHEHLPFWKTFFQALGFNPVVSGPTTREIADLGAQKMPVETCMPIKILYGHAVHLLNQGIERIFVPHTSKLKPDGENTPCFLCPYTQAIGYIIRAKACPQTLILEYPQDPADKGWIYVTAKNLDIKRQEVASAVLKAHHAQMEFKQRCREYGKQTLAELASPEKNAVVLIGRPYTLSDRYTTMDLARQLERLGVVPIPMDFLDLESEQIPPFFEDLHWYLGRQALKAADFVRKNEHLACIFLTNFGCGPDAFIAQYIESLLQHTPHLILEFDEHRADTGMLTRIEAFIRNLSHMRGWSRKDVFVQKRPVRKDRPLRDYHYYIQRFSDHAYAYAGALRAAGCQAEILPPTDQASITLAKRYVHGNECHPYQAVLGDLLKLVRRDVFHPNGAVYYTPKYDGPCLLNQYGTAIRLVLERVGASEVTLLNIGDMAVMDELFPIYPLYLARASHAIDRLHKWSTEIRPQERNRGEVLAVHRGNMELLLKRMEKRRLDAGIQEAIANMLSIELETRNGRPVIGIAGDIYTRLNEHANFGLYEKLNAMGFEVWTSALVMDVVLLGYEQRFKDLLDRGEKLKGFMAKGYLRAAELLRRSVDRYFPEAIRTPQESSFPRLYQRVSPHISHRVDKFISLNINRIGEFHEAGADGVLNVMCPGCMVGTVSEAFFPELRQQYDNLPMETLAFGDQQTTHIDNRLEAFAQLVHEAWNKKRARNFPPGEYFFPHPGGKIT